MIPLLILGIATAMPLRAWAAVDVVGLAARFESQGFPRPPHVAAAAVTGNGVHELMGLNVARLSWALVSLDPTTPSARKVVVDGLASLVEQSHNATRVSEGGFAEALFAELAGMPALSAETDRVKAAASAMAADRFAYSDTYGKSSAQVAADRAAVDVPGKQRAVREALEALLARARSGDGSAWTRLRAFLKRRLEKQRTEARADLFDKLRVGSELSVVFADAYKGDDGAPLMPADRIAALSKAELARDRLYVESFEKGLAPGATPASYLTGPAKSLAAAMRAADDVALDALSLPRMNQKNGSSVIDGLMGVWALLERAERRGKLGPRGHIMDRLEALHATALRGYKALAWDHEAIDSKTGASVAMPAARRAAIATDAIFKFMRDWAATGRPPKPLYAAVETDAGGQPSWNDGGWLNWRWLEADELADAQADGRVTTVAGKRWLLPVGADSSGLKDIASLLAAGALELRVAIDPAGPWTAP